MVLKGTSIDFYVMWLHIVKVFKYSQLKPETNDFYMRNLKRGV